MSEKRVQMITITELAYFVGARKQIIERLVRLDVIEPVSSDPEYTFSTEIIPQIKKIIKLHKELGVSWTSMGLVLDLLDKIRTLEDALKQYETQE